MGAHRSLSEHTAERHPQTRCRLSEIRGALLIRRKSAPLKLRIGFCNLPPWRCFDTEFASEHGGRFRANTEAILNLPQIKPAQRRSA